MTRKGTCQMCKKESSIKGLLLILCLFLAPLLTGFELLGFASYSWHQKMTVEVEVNGEIYSGASVVGMNVFRHPDIPLVHGNLDFGMEGEADMVELPDQRYLFALLTYNAGLAVKAFSDVMSLKDRQSSEKWAIVTTQKGKVRELAPKDYPLLVTFTDINDPTTVKQVDSANLAATFGPGVLLKRITLEITDEPVTEGKIESVLGWWCDLRKKRARLNGSTSIGIADNELSNNLGTGSFRIGDCT